VLALRAGTQLQIFNLELRAKMKSYAMQEPLIYWRWVSPNLIALITQSGVYHWSIEGDAPPVKLDKFDVFPEGTQVRGTLIHASTHHHQT
jgi:clathrin heavy chain